MAVCKLCKGDRTLIKAHVIPRSLYAPLFEESSPITVYSTEKGCLSKAGATAHPRLIWVDAVAGIAGALILTWLFYAYQRWRFDDYDARARQRAEGASGAL